MAYLMQDMISVKPIFGAGRVVVETMIHHVIGLVGIISALVIGRIVGVIAGCLLFTEISTIFLNYRCILKELGLSEKPDYKFKNQLNGYFLMGSYFLARVVFIGLILIFYVIPALFDYPYDKVAKEIGWFKVRWAQTLMVLFLALYIMNIYWFTKLVQGY